MIPIGDEDGITLCQFAVTCGASLAICVDDALNAFEQFRRFIRSIKGGEIRLKCGLFRLNQMVPPDGQNQVTGIWTEVSPAWTSPPLLFNFSYLLQIFYHKYFRLRLIPPVYGQNDFPYMK